MENFFNIINLIKIFLRWKKHLIIVLSASIVLGVLLSSPWFIKPRYTSYSIVYPVNLNELSKESLSEQMLQWLESDEIRDNIIKDFDLIKHWEIDTIQIGAKAALVKLYDKFIQISKTKYESIKISATHENPQTAYDIVNAIIKYYNLKVKNSRREKALEHVKTKEEILQKSKSDLDSVEKKLNHIHQEYGLVDYQSQANQMARGFLRTIDGNNSREINTSEVLKLKKNIEIAGREYHIYTTRMFDLLSEYNLLREDYFKLLQWASNNLSYAYIVVKPFVNDKKSYPVRWLIVASSFFATLFLSILLISIIEGWKQFAPKLDIKNEPKK